MQFECAVTRKPTSYATNYSFTSPTCESTTSGSTTSTTSDSGAVSGSEFRWRGWIAVAEFAGRLFFFNFHSQLNVNSM